MEPKPKDSHSEKDAKSPNIIERAKEEIEAVFHRDKSPGHHKETHGNRDDINEKTDLEEVKAPNMFERVKEEIEAVFHHDRSPRHHKETHGNRDDINENTDLEEVKGPNMFERVKEEIEAVVEAVHPKKGSGGHESSSK